MNNLLLVYKDKGKKKQLARRFDYLYFDLKFFSLHTLYPVFIEYSFLKNVL